MAVPTHFGSPHWSDPRQRTYGLGAQDPSASSQYAREVEQLQKMEAMKTQAMGYNGSAVMGSSNAASKSETPPVATGAELVKEYHQRRKAIILMDEL